jgi:hypothetical protein
MAGMQDISDDQLLLVLTILELLHKPSPPHQVRVAYHRANKQLEAYKSLPASQKPVTDS